MSDMSEANEELVARLRRMNYETEKFIAEHDKLAAEAKKLERDRAIAPWQMVTTMMGAGAAIFAAGAAFVKLLG